MERVSRGTGTVYRRRRIGQPALRLSASRLAADRGVTVRFPPGSVYSTDNAAMIASAGYFLMQERPEAVNRLFLTSMTEDVTSVLQ